VQLHNYWDIVVSRIGVVVGAFLVAVVAATASVFFVPQTAAPYQASLVLAVKPQAEPGSDNYYRYDGYYAYVSSEYTNDDLISIIQTTDFLQAVRDHLQSKIGSAPTGSLDGKKAHRVVTITASSPTANGALALAQGVADLLTAPDAEQKFFATFAPENVTVTMVDQPRIVAGPVGRSSLLNVAARSLIGLGLGIGLAFLLEYLDDSVRRTDVEGLLGWPVLGEIPGRGLPPMPRKVK
jgi:capsular polysaccharide biosynthesis protein